MKLDQNNKTSRRNFLKTTAAAGGGLVIAFHLPGTLRRAAAQVPSLLPKTYPPNAFIRIAPDNRVTITINKLEMGQGVFTSMAQLISEELDCDWKNVSSVGAPVDPVYNHTHMPTQMTGGSMSLSSSYEQHRRIGAMARAMLVQAAAKKWGVSPDTCRTENGFILHDVKGKISYGEVADAANQMPMPKGVKLKDPKDFKVIGQSMQRVDAVDKSTGKAIFGIDVRVPEMSYAMILRPPVFGATLVKFDGAKAKAVAGVTHVLKLENSVAVIAKNTWAARTGRDSVEAEWNLNGKDKVSNASLAADFKKMSEKPSAVAKDSAAAVENVKKARNVLHAEYELPYLAHAPMEPMNCTIHYDGRSCELWAGHQMPTVDRDTAAKLLNLTADNVKVHTVYAGGSFGRRGNKNADYVVEACQVAKQFKKPVKVMWTREDDMRGGYYRPMSCHVARIATDKNGDPSDWHHTVVSQSIFRGGIFEAMMAGKAFDQLVVEGIHDSQYKIPNFHVDVEMPTLDIPTLWWRSVGHSHTAFVMETLIDDLASRAKVDPLKYRRRLLKASPRHLAVLDLLAKTSPWGKAAPKGRAYGLAVHESFNSVVGHVAEVSLQGTKPVIHHVWSAVHCGRVINPEGAKTQVEGAIVVGLSAALYGRIQIENGRMVTGNFNDYPVLRMNEMPKVEVHFVASDDNPTGLGEPGLPPIAPAVANAMFRLNGKRIRKLPMV